MKNKYQYIIEEKTAFRRPINIIEGWLWNFYDHIRLSFLYKNSQFSENNENRDKRPFHNIIRPILNAQYRTEGFDVKDIEIFVDNSDIYYKSFLTKKFHDKWASKNEMDTFIDELVESYVDYGGVLTRNTNEIRPEIVDLKTIAFCDQTNFLSGPFAILHYMSPDELRKMTNSGWGDSKKGATIDIESLIEICERNQEYGKYDQKNRTPGKYIEIYELHGTLPENWIGRNQGYEEDNKYVSQVQIVAFYKNNKDQEIGVTLFASKEPKLPFKFLIRDKVQGRALGFGGIEELFEAQVWTNYNEVQIREMLELASKIFYKTTDSRFKTRNNIANRETGTVFDLQQGTDINQLDTSPRNINVFENAVRKWEDHAQIIGAAGESLLGESPSSGTPFKLYEAQLIEAKSLHVWRKGKIATFVGELYRDWILPHLAEEIAKGDEFITELSAEELQEVMEKIALNYARQQIKEEVLNGQLPSNENELIDKFKKELLHGGRKRFIKILEDEFKVEDLGINVNIAGKQKDLSLITDKVVNVLRQFISTPQIRQDPEMLKLLNVILESSGLSPIMFAPTPLVLPQQTQGGINPLENLNKITKETAAINA